MPSKSNRLATVAACVVWVSAACLGTIIYQRSHPSQEKAFAGKWKESNAYWNDVFLFASDGTYHQERHPLFVDNIGQTQETSETGTWYLQADAETPKGMDGGTLFLKVKTGSPFIFARKISYFFDEGRKKVRFSDPDWGSPQEFVRQ